MKIVLKPILRQIEKEIDQIGPENIQRIDLDETEFERLVQDLQYLDLPYEVSAENIKVSRPRRGSYLKIKDVCVQCCYEDKVSIKKYYEQNKAECNISLNVL